MRKISWLIKTLLHGVWCKERVYKNVHSNGKWHIQTELHDPFEELKVPNNMVVLSSPTLLDVRPITALYKLDVLNLFYATGRESGEPTEPLSDKRI
jgi:hypothetical protein